LNPFLINIDENIIAQGVKKINAMIVFIHIFLNLEQKKTQIA